MQQALQGIDQTFGDVPGKVAEIVRKGADKVAAESQKAFLKTGQAIAEGNFSRAVNVTEYAAQEIQVQVDSVPFNQFAKVVNHETAVSSARSVSSNQTVSLVRQCSVHQTLHAMNPT